MAILKYFMPSNYVGTGMTDGIWRLLTDAQKFYLQHGKGTTNDKAKELVREMNKKKKLTVEIENGFKKLYGLGFCGCGNPDTAYEALRDTLACFDAGDISDGDWKARCERVDAWFKERGEGYSYLLLYFIDAAGLLEHGGSVGGSWLTEEGKNVLAVLRDWGTDPDEWPSLEEVE